MAAHPDDEVLGCGGTMAKHAASGDQIDVIFMTDGESSRLEEPHNIPFRQQNARAVNHKLNIAEPIFLDFPDNKMDSVPLLDVVQALESKVSNKSYNIVYTHFSDDLNVDHRITFEAVATCFRPMPQKTRPKILCFEVNSSTEWQINHRPKFNPNYFVDISDYVDKKWELLKCYEQELRPFPHSRSIEAIKALVCWRGCSVGVVAAEAFILVREVA